MTTGKLSSWVSLGTGVNLSWLALRSASPITLILGSGSCLTSASHCSTDNSNSTGSERRNYHPITWKNNKASLCSHWVFQAKKQSHCLFGSSANGFLNTLHPCLHGCPLLFLQIIICPTRSSKLGLSILSTSKLISLPFAWLHSIQPPHRTITV